jgi:hypothetical protein
MPATQETGRELWCLAEDEFRPFLIRISPTRYVYDLEELVVAKCTVDRLRDLDPRDVILMKVRHITSFMFTSVTNTRLLHPADRRRLPRKPN